MVGLLGRIFRKRIHKKELASFLAYAQALKGSLLNDNSENILLFAKGYGEVLPALLNPNHLVSRFDYLRNVSANSSIDPKDLGEDLARLVSGIIVEVAQNPNVVVVSSVFTKPARRLRKRISKYPGIEARVVELVPVFLEALSKKFYLNKKQQRIITAVAAEFS